MGSASGQIAQRAVELMRHPHLAPCVAQIAAKLGVTEPHLRRAFHASVGVTPIIATMTVELNDRVYLAPQIDAAGKSHSEHLSGFEIGTTRGASAVNRVR